MFNKRLIISLSIFFYFYDLHFFCKTQNKKFRKKINNLNSEIGVLKKHLKDAKTDYVFLSSPEQLKKYLITLNINDFSIYDASRIFSQQINLQFTKINKLDCSILSKNEKNTKKSKPKRVFILMNIIKMYLMRKKIII